jgi:hypothetical protein
MSFIQDGGLGSYLPRQHNLTLGQVKNDLYPVRKREFIP